jgi:hypothetical protein
MLIKNIKGLVQTRKEAESLNLLKGRTLQQLPISLTITVILLITFYNVLAQTKVYLPLDSSRYISTTEVTNKEYKDFLLNAPLIDELTTKVYKEGWKKFENPPKYWVAYFGPFPNHPVVNIQQEGARAYCRLLTEEYEQSRTPNEPKVIYRLPTENEWKTAALKYQADILYFDSLYKIKMYEPDSVMEANNWTFEGADPAELYTPGSKYEEMTDYVMSDQHESTHLICRSGFPNTNKPILKHMKSNVSEWLAEDDKAIGINWEDTEQARKEIKKLPKPYVPFEADFASAKIGFRVLKEVIKD